MCVLKAEIEIPYTSSGVSKKNKTIVCFSKKSIMLTEATFIWLYL